MLCSKKGGANNFIMTTASSQTDPLDLLKTQFRQNLSRITSLQDSVKNNKQQLREVSEEATSIINHKLKTNKNQPVFNPEYDSTRLTTLEKQRQTVYHDIEVVKKQIHRLKNQKQDHIAEQVCSKQSMLLRLERQIAQIQAEKQQLKKKCDQNKVIMDSHENEQLAKEVQKNEKELLKTRKKCSDYNMRIRELTGTEIISNMYILELRSRLELKGKAVPSVVPAEQFKKILGEINQINLQKERIRLECIQELNAVTEQIERQKKANARLKLGFKQEAMETAKTNRHHQTTLSLHRHTLSRDITHSTHFLAKSHRVYRESDAITVGDWSENGSTQIIGDSIKGRMHKVIQAQIYVSGGSMVGVKCLYQRGNETVWGSRLLTSHLLAFDTISVTLEEILTLKYDTNPQNIYFLFQPKNGTLIQVGKLKPYSLLKSLDLKLNCILNFQLLIEPSPTLSYSSILKAVRFRVQAMERFQQIFQQMKEKELDKVKDTKSDSGMEDRESQDNQSLLKGKGADVGTTSIIIQQKPSAESHRSKTYTLIKQKKGTFTDLRLLVRRQ